MASKNPVEGTSKSVNFLGPIFTCRADLPSPPPSTQTSPPFATNPTISHNYSQQSYLPPTLSSPISQLPDVDFRAFGRKRSHEDPVQEPPSKRVSLTQSAASSSTLTPSTLNGITPTVPRLPMPNLTISTNNPGGSYGLPPAQMHMPTRPMSTAFPGPGRWPQNGMLPSLQPPAYFSGNVGSPMNEWPNRRSPFRPGSTTPSPTSLNFPHSQQTPSHQSPSGCPVPRSSPYKPVRSVNTLLVPPTSASMHDPPQHLGFDQMHYQPLGKPISERRAGVLPYMHHDTWSQSHQTPHSLPEPHF